MAHEPPTLTYGRAAGPDRRRFARPAAVVLLLLAAAAPVGWYLWDHTANAYYYSLRARLDTVPGVTYDIGTREDEDEIEGFGPGRVVQYVEVHIGGDPRRRIALWPDAGTFDGGGELRVVQFGRFYFPNGIPLSPGSPVAGVLPLPRPVRKLSDLVDHYDELLAAMEAWPRGPGTVTDGTGRRHDYEVVAEEDPR